MARPKHKPTGIERTFDRNEIIVSKTDLNGVITYANDVFQRVSMYSEEELLGQPHNCIRHPDMPKCVFKLLWDTIESGKEIFAYVINLAKDGAHYWVFAHVTPSYDLKGNMVGFHSSRRVPDREAVEKVIPLYQKLKEIEDQASSPKEGMEQATNYLLNLLWESGVEYDEFIFSITPGCNKSAKV